VISALSQLNGVSIRLDDQALDTPDQGIDLLIEAQAQGQSFVLLVEIKTYGYPRDVRDAAGMLEKVRDHLAHTIAPRIVVPMFVAPAISETSRKLLREQGIAYWDTSGSLSLDLPWAHYLIEKPSPKQPERVLRDVYRGSSAQVLHALLLDHTRAWHLSELARRAEVAVSTAHQVCAYLERQLWMDREGKGPKSVRVLREPGVLLDAWAASYSLGRYEHVRYHRWAQSQADLLDIVLPAFTANDVEYALTLETGGSLIAPYATPGDRAWIIVPSAVRGRLEDVAAQAGLRRVDEGDRVTFLVARERAPLLFCRQIEGVWVASDVQIYLDLHSWPMRGQEQARHLRAERLPY
jgi:hypothetical protein